MNRLCLFASATVLGFLLLGIGSPAVAVPNATIPALLGVDIGGEVGVVGMRVDRGTPYYVYASAGVARSLAIKAEVLGGSGRPDMRLVTAQFKAIPIPIPMVTMVLEPGIVSFHNMYGPTLGVRCTGSVPFVGLNVTGYAREHFVDTRFITELGVGADHALFGPVRLSLSAIEFAGGVEPNGILFLAGLKAHLGL